jgi:hypothetical protein
MWKDWKESLIIVKPNTVVRGHRKGFFLYWARLSRQRHIGRPGTGKEVRDLIGKLAEANPLWGIRRIGGELLKLGINISERTLARLMPKGNEPPSQTWRTFLDNHLKDLVSIDCLFVPTAHFESCLC